MEVVKNKSKEGNQKREEEGRKKKRRRNEENERISKNRWWEKDCDDLEKKLYIEVFRAVWRLDPGFI